MSKVICSVCGSEDVQAQVWVYLNQNFQPTTEFVDEMIEEPFRCWCGECEKFDAKLIVVDDNYVHVPTPPKEKVEPQHYTCPGCYQETLRYAMIDLDETNLEEGYCCSECGAEFIGLHNEQVLEINEELKNDE